MHTESTPEFYSNVEALGEKVQKIAEPPKIVVFISELPLGAELAELVNGLGITNDKISSKYSIDFSNTQNWGDIDKVLITIARDAEIEEANKTKFLRLLRLKSNDLLTARIANSISGDLTVLQGTEQPVTASYLANTEKARIFFEELKIIKQEVKQTAHNLIYSGFENYATTPLLDIPEETRLVILNRIKAFNPSTKEESGAIELVKHFNGEQLDMEQEVLSKLQYLRILKEKVNLLLTDNNESQILLNEQLEEDTPNPIRIGDLTTLERTRKTRRHSLLANIHYGVTPMHRVGEDTKTDFIPMDPDLLKFVDQLKLALKDNKESELFLNEISADTKEHLEWLRQHREVLITGEVKREIVMKVLGSLGLASSETDSRRQQEDYENNRPTIGISTLTACVINTASIYSYEHKNKMLVIPGKEPSRLDGSLDTLGHEMTHGLQDIRRDKSPVGLMKTLRGFGRSLILAEMGAMHNESMIQQLFGEPNEYWSDYEYKILFGYLEGKTFMQLIEIAFKPIYENDTEVTRIPKDLYFDPITNKDIPEESKHLGTNKKIFKTANVAIRRVLRLYKDLGATGDGENTIIKKFPNTWSMAYLLGLFPKYTQYSSTLSGVPTHRIEELKDLLPDFSINGVKVTDSMIIRIFIDATYEVMKAKLEQPATSI